MFTYRQSTGELFDPTGERIGIGYAGHGEGTNDPAMESIANIGPLPRGRYFIGPAYDHPKLGPVTMNLTRQIHRHRPELRMVVGRPDEVAAARQRADVRDRLHRGIVRPFTVACVADADPLAGWVEEFPCGLSVSEHRYFPKYAFTS